MISLARVPPTMTTGFFRAVVTGGGGGGALVVMSQVTTLACALPGLGIRGGSAARHAHEPP